MARRTAAIMQQAGTTDTLIAEAHKAGFGDVRHDGRWLRFSMIVGSAVYAVSAIVFDAPSEYGIGAGRISHIEVYRVADDGRRRIFHYDRGSREIDAIDSQVLSRIVLAFRAGDGRSEADELAGAVTGYPTLHGLMDVPRMVPSLNLCDPNARRLAELYDDGQEARGCLRRVHGYYRTDGDY